MTNYEIKAIILRDDASIGGTCPAAQIRFPATRYELTDALERARVSASHPGFTLTEYQCRIPGLAELLPARTHLEGLNLLAHRLAKLAEWDRMAYEGLLKTDDHPKTLGNLVNLTHNLAACQCVDVADDGQLGRLLVEEDLLPELKDVSEQVLEWLDYTKVGAAQRKKEHGVFVSSGYVVNDAVDWKQAYPEELCPEDVSELDTPIDGVFRLFAHKRDRPEEGGMWFDLPTDREQMLAAVGAADPAHCRFLYARSSLPPLNALLEPYEDFNYLNEIARTLVGVPDTNRLLFKAALEYVGITDLSEAAKLAQEFREQFELFPELSSADDYKVLVISERVGPQLSEHDLYCLLSASGKSMMERDQARFTDYGIVRMKKGERKKTSETSVGDAG